MGGPFSGLSDDHEHRQRHNDENEKVGTLALLQYILCRKPGETHGYRQLLPLSRILSQNGVGNRSPDLPFSFWKRLPRQDSMQPFFYRMSPGSDDSIPHL